MVEGDEFVDVSLRVAVIPVASWPHASIAHRTAFVEASGEAITSILTPRVVLVVYTRSCRRTSESVEFVCMHLLVCGVGQAVQEPDYRRGLTPHTALRNPETVSTAPGKQTVRCSLK